MPATAYCSLSRSPPGPWPVHYSSVQFICYFCSSFTYILYYVYLMLLAIGPNKVVLIPGPDSVGPFYLVSMPGGKCVTCRGLHILTERRKTL